MKLIRIDVSIFKSGWLKKYLLIMRLICLLTLFFTLQISASVWSQNTTMSIKLKKSTLQELFSQIEKSSNYRFFYNNDEVDVNQTISIDMEEKTVGKILAAALETTPYSFKEMENKLILIERKDGQSKSFGFEMQQQKSVIGKVTDSSGTSLPGVSVVVKGTTTGVITDMDGKYTLAKIPENATLQFSFVGMKTQEITIAGKTTLNVRLEEETVGIEEVVAVGYGVQKKVNITGSISNIKSEELSKRQVGQSSMLLQGSASGVTVTQRSGQPGNDSGSIRIRGIGTLSDSNPLTLVDGVEMSINNVDPNIIESISVLKDAASSSIYGSRAANGVILVTTKRANASKPSFNYNGYFGWQNPTDLPDKVNALDHMILLDEAYTNTGKTPIFTDKIAEYKTYGQSDPDRCPDTDWQEKMLRTGTIQNHFLSVNAGNENLKILGSFGYFNQQGNLNNTGFERYSFRLNTDMKITKNLTTKIDAFLRQNQSTEPSLSVEECFYQMNRLPANLPGVYSNGLYGEGATSYNPIAWVHDGGTSVVTTPNVLLNFNAIYKPISWLTADVLFAPYFVIGNTKTYTKAITLYNPDYSVYSVYPTKTSLSEKQDKSTNKTFKASVLLDRSIKDHNLKLLLGFSREKYSNYWFSAYREVFLFPEYSVLNAGGEENKSNGGAGGGWSLQSYFGRLNYDFKGKYLFEANGRYDGSSRFSKGNKYSFFPSVSAGWRISEESFMESTKGWLDNMKIRASWGQLGNQNIGGSYYPYSSYISLTSNYNIGNSVVTGARLLDMANADLSWETTKMWNIGTDFSLFGKLNITAEYFSKRTTGILLQLDIPGIVGLNAPYQNAGIVTNKGWEIGASYHNNIGYLKYEIIANISDVINNVVDINGVTKTSLTQSREGYPINSIYGHVALGLFKDAADVTNSPKQQFGNTAPGDIKYKNLNDDNVINDLDQEIIGSTIPRYTYSFNLNLNYKKIDFSMFWQGIGKADGYLNNSAIMPFFNGGTVQEQHKNRWTLDNQNVNATFPRLTIGEPNNLRNSTWWLKSAAYLRLKNIQLGYSFSEAWMKNIGLQHLKFYVSGENLLTFDKFWDGFDVEAPIGSGNYYPQLRTLSLGIDLRF